MTQQTSKKNIRRVLRGDHNQCPSCGEFFNSTYAFEKHRIGKHGVDRRCMTTEEMIAAGMSLSKDDFWITGKMPQEILDDIAEEVS